jgi:hypothetical protein
MKKNRTFSMILSITILLFLSGCSTTQVIPSKSANYGPYPDNYKTMVYEYMETILVDPDSAKYKSMSEPVKAYTRKAPILGGDVDVYGWYTRVCLNAKNSLGGYTGYKCRKLLIKYNSVIKQFKPNIFFSEHWYN